MRNLVSAGFAKLRKDRSFWFTLFLMFCWSGLQLSAPWIEAMQDPAFKLPVLDELFVQYYPIVGGLSAVFTGQLLGTEHSDGTMRNKIIAGHSRVAVYLSNFVVSTAAGWLLIAAWIVPMLVFGIPLFGMLENPFTAAVYTLVSLFMIAALTAIFSAFAMLISNKTNAVISIMSTFLLMLMLGSACYNQLCEPEIIRGGDIVVEQGGNVSMEMLEPESNPAYVSGNTRRILTVIRDVLPTGQAIQMANREEINLPMWLLYSSMIVFLSTGAGIVLFEKKDLK